VTLPSTPPPELRSSITERERAQIVEVLGEIPDEPVLLAVRDGRGRQFQRLEFLGDSVLDVLLAVHQWCEPQCPHCGRPGAVTDSTDRHLAQVAVQTGLGAWLEWAASDERLADLVETCVAACWLAGRWPQALAFASRVVHPMGAETARVLSEGNGVGDPGSAARRVGSGFLELAAADGLMQILPTADEGELSQRRAQVHRASAIANVAKGRDASMQGDPEQILSRVEDQVAEALATSGGDAALAVAEGFVPVAAR
jgi:dsRNA-specific ribonuclease